MSYEFQWKQILFWCTSQNYCKRLKCDNLPLVPSHLPHPPRQVLFILKHCNMLVENVMVYIFMWCTCGVMRCVPGLVWTRRAPDAQYNHSFPRVSKTWPYLRCWLAHAGNLTLLRPSVGQSISSNSVVLPLMENTCTSRGRVRSTAMCIMCSLVNTFVAFNSLLTPRQSDGAATPPREFGLQRDCVALVFLGMVENVNDEIRIILLSCVSNWFMVLYLSRPFTSLSVYSVLFSRVTPVYAHAAHRKSREHLFSAETSAARQVSFCPFNISQNAENDAL